MDPYRLPPPIHQVLDISCRRCGHHGLLYAYWPCIRPDPGPLCRVCFSEWRGQSRMQYCTQGVGFFSFPLEEDWPRILRPRQYETITAFGPRPSVSPWLDE